MKRIRITKDEELFLQLYHCADQNSRRADPRFEADNNF